MDRNVDRYRNGGGFVGRRVGVGVCRGTTNARGDLELERVSPLWGPGTKIRIRSPLVLPRPIYYENMSQIPKPSLLSMPVRPSLACSYLY